MVTFAPWKIVLVVLVALFGFAYAAPNLLPAKTVEQWQDTLPGWMPTKQVNLGLDLRGGAYVLLGVDVDTVLEERLENLVGLIRRELRSERLRYTGLGVQDGAAVFTLRDPSQLDEIRSPLRDLEQGTVLNVDRETGRVALSYSDDALDQLRSDVVAQSIEVVRRRVDATGLREPVIQRQGDNRILLQLPGVEDTGEILDLIKQTAKLTFHLVDETVAGATESRRDVPAGTMILPFADAQPGQPDTLPVRRQVVVGGESLTNAQSTFNQSGQSVVAFQFDGAGSRRFCRASTENVGRRLAIVIDEEVVSAPVLREPICGGRGEISGSFSPASAEQLAIQLRSGALPAPIRVLEERTVGPSLGQDSIEAGQSASVVALGLVIVFMVITYSLFGVFATGALIVNMALIFGVLSWLQATLTLPGLAGIVLTVGMAVDANVLIFERIREELRNGRTVISAVDAGYSQAIGTIVDSNLTTLIAALFGSGPVKGFAVTLSIGIASSMFCAILVTRLMVVTWLRRARPKALPI
mgnify:FL=1